MPLNEKHRSNIILLFCIVFYVLMAFKWYNQQLLYQLQPAIFNTRFDLTTWLLMHTGLHQWLLNNPFGWLLFDAAFYAIPLLFGLIYKWKPHFAPYVAGVMLFVNFIYIQCYTLYPADSIEGFTAWLLFPLLFLPRSLTTFYYILHGLRYFVLFIFTSAAFWKIWQGSAFNLEQMSGILLFQHKEYVVSSPNHWYTLFIFWLVNHPLISYMLFAGAILLEMSFIIGFFRKRYDRQLIAAFMLFIVLDILIMRINYWEISAFLIPLWYSRYSVPVTNKS